MQQGSAGWGARGGGGIGTQALMVNSMGIYSNITIYSWKRGAPFLPSPPPSHRDTLVDMVRGDRIRQLGD